MEPTNATKAYSKISPTAKLTAYWRTKSDIPYASEIALATHAEKTAQELLGEENSPLALFSAPAIEARYKAVNAALKKSGLSPVLEVACGLSPRGLEIAAQGNVYVGTDLPEIAAETFPVIRDIALREGIPAEKLHLQPVNVLDKDELAGAAAHFRGIPFALCHEGLLMYLDRPEKKLVCSHIRERLLQAGGAWVTTDLAYHEIMFNALKHGSLGDALKENAESRLKGIAQMTGRNFQDNYFSGEDEAITFYAKQGFSIQAFPMYDGSYRLASLEIIPPEGREPVLELLKVTKVWILTPIA